MILTCPSCATSYFTPDDAVGPAGRKVRCQACGETWRAQSDEPLELTQSAGDTPIQSALRAEFGKREDPPESLAETPAPELPRAYRAKVQEERRVRRAAAHGVVWAGLASAFVAVLGAAWLFRVEVVDLYPRAAAAYAMVGSPVNPVGLQFEAVGAKAMLDHPDRVIVSGALRNVRDREIVAPKVRVALLDAHGAEIGHQVVAIDAAPVLPGGVQGFAAMIPDPAQKGAGVGVDFVAEPAFAKPGHEAAAPHAAAPAASPAAHQPDAADHPPAPAVRRPPTAPEGGLRPAVDPSSLAPVRAPVDAAPAPEPLDKGHGEAVTASHHG